jgi:hypothetical protein
VKRQLTEAQRDRKREWTRRWYALHREQSQAKTTKWKKENPEKVRAYKSAYNSKHYEERRKVKRAWYIAHRDKVKEMRRQYYIANAESIRKKARDAGSKSKDAVAARNKANRAIASGRLVCPGTCANCGGTENIEGHHINYNRPLALTWLCASCHRLHHVDQKRKDQK